MKSRLLFLVIVLFAVGCRSQKPPELPDKTPSFNRDECFVRARVLDVMQDTAAVNEPCNEYPCLAKVKVVKVITCGKISGNKPAQGQERIVRFRFTVSSQANELFPKLKYELPGLKKGDLFDAIWEFRPAMEGQPAYPIIYDYKKI